MQTRINHRVVEHNRVLYFGGLIADDLSVDMKGQTHVAWHLIMRMPYKRFQMLRPAHNLRIGS
jgi:hypothetical protein